MAARSPGQEAQIEKVVIGDVLARALAQSRRIVGGHPAQYIPELAQVDVEQTSAAILLRDGSLLSAGDVESHRFTLQSSAKLITLIGLLEELGPEAVFRAVGPEPSGAGFASLARLDAHGPTPANPLVNAGAIALCGQLRGSTAARIEWIRNWTERLYGERLSVNDAVFRSEQRTGDRNRAIAYLLKGTGMLAEEVDETLEVYFALCSLEADALQAVRLPALLANGGIVAGTDERVISEDTAAMTLSLMTTCGMYDESGAYLLHTGMPAKSGVSGVIVAVALGRAGIVASSPRINDKGGSLRGHAILRTLSRELGWHMGRPGPHV